MVIYSITVYQVHFKLHVKWYYALCASRFVAETFKWLGGVLTFLAL